MQWEVFFYAPEFLQVSFIKYSNFFQYCAPVWMLTLFFKQWYLLVLIDGSIILIRFQHQAKPEQQTTKSTVSIVVVKYRGPILRVTRPALGSYDSNLDQSGMSIQILPEPNTGHVTRLQLYTIFMHNKSIIKILCFLHSFSVIHIIFGWSYRRL